MNHDEIIAMAREAGLSFVPDASSPLVRIVRKAVQVERERFALECIGSAKASLHTFSPEVRT